MQRKTEILTELQEIAPILGNNETFRVPYAVPAGYFMDFVEILKLRIRLETSGFSETATEEIHSISPLLAGLQKKNPFQAPIGFFESLPVKIPEVTKPRARIISMPVRVIRYAAAACITALIGITAFNITFHRNILDPIVGLKMVSDQDMANFLDADDIHWTPGITTQHETASVDFSDNDIHDLLSNVPDDELEQYAPSLPVQKGNVN